MLSGTVSGDTAGFVAPGNSTLRLKIEMLLAADHELSTEAQRTGFDDRRIAICDPERAGKETTRGNRILYRKDRRQRFVVDANALGAEARGLERLAQHPGDGLLVKH